MARCWPIWVLQRGSVPNEIFREMRAGTLGFIGYSLFAGFSIPGIDNAAHLGGLLGAGDGRGAGPAGGGAEPVSWRSPGRWAVALSVALGAGLWWSAPQSVRRFEVDSAYTQALQRFSVDEQELLREQAASSRRCARNA